MFPRGAPARKGRVAACGFYRPEPPVLDAIRAAIAETPAAFKRMTTALAKAGLALDADEDALKRPPRGFGAVTDTTALEALRRRSCIIRRKLTAAEIGDPALVALLAGFAAASLPLLRFGWTAAQRSVA
jgi:uncharacterized protein (DUF2461 family)